MGAFGGVLVNISLRQSFLHHHNGNSAYVTFLAFYAVCAALTWVVYLRPRRMVVPRHLGTEAGAPLEQAVQSDQAVAEQAVAEQAVAEQAVAEQAVAEQAVAEQAALASLAGYVCTADGPVAAATVTLLDPRGREIARTRSQADGGYAFAELPVGRYMLVCGTAGVYEPIVTLIDVDPQGTASPPMRLAPVPVADDPLSEILGTVSAVGVPVASALVTVLDESGAVLASGWTDETGYYRVGPTRGGPVTVTVAVQGRRPTASALHLSSGTVVHDLRMDT
jgi:hypothetical protein